MTTRSASKPVLIDSSGWLEYLTEDSKADLFAPYFQAEGPVLVPTIVLYEVRKILLMRRSKAEADQFVSQALRNRVVGLDEILAIAAAQVSVTHQLSMADAIIYATAQAHEALLVTSDPHFGGLPGLSPEARFACESLWFRARMSSLHRRSQRRIRPWRRTKTFASRCRTGKSRKCRRARLRRRLRGRFRRGLPRRRWSRAWRPQTTAKAN